MKRILCLLTAFILAMLLLPAALAADPVPVESITLNLEEAEVFIGKTLALKAAVTPRNATAKKVEWISSDESIATVNNGKVKAIAPGTVTITAKATDESGAGAEAKITVLRPVKKIIIEGDKTVPLAEGISWQLTAHVEPMDATRPELVWTSSNDQIASVDENGKVTGGTKAGTATITAAATDGSKVKASVKVRLSVYDLVFTDTEPQKVYYSYGSGQWHFRASVKNGNVSIPPLDTTVFAIIFGKSTDSLTVTPVKGGEDEVTISTGHGKLRYKVFVSPAIFAETEAEENTPPEETTAVSETFTTDAGGELRFDNIPWGVSYEEIKASGRTMKALAKWNKFLRARIDGEIKFGNVTAYDSALIFSYDPDDENYKINNRLFEGTYYFKPEVSLSKIQKAVKTVYSLGDPKQQGEDYVWTEGDITLTLSPKERFTTLTISKATDN